jgi:hypothetical protein
MDIIQVINRIKFLESINKTDEEIKVLKRKLKALCKGNCEKCKNERCVG